MSVRRALACCAMLILLAHGSPDPRWLAAIEKLADAVRSELGADEVRVAYLQCAPTLTEVVGEAVANGTRFVRVLPLFLAGPGHVERDIRPQVDRLREEHGPADVEMLPPIGEHPLFSDFLCKVAGQSEH